MNTHSVRPAAVAGMFYPGDPAELANLVDGFLSLVAAAAIAPPAILVPHAGYVYSGPTAAHGFGQWRQANIRHVVILGPTHRVGIDAVALPDADALATPLGEVPVWAAGTAAIEHLPQVVSSAAVHRDEHSLEVQLPFLQRVLGDFDVLPLAVGWVTPALVAQIIDELWETPGLGVVVSSDLSHFHTYDQARAIDRATIDQVLALDATIDHDQACGATGLDAMLMVAARRHLTARLLAACNSGDTAGDKHRVVGYASAAFDSPTAGAA